MLTFSVYALVGVDEQSTRHTSTPKGRFVLRADSIRPYSGVCALNRVLAKIQRFGRMLCPYKVLFNAVSER